MNTCIFCGEPVLPEEQDRWLRQTAHHECSFRAISGSAAHIEKRCSCFVPESTENDDPALTKRQAALAAVAAYRRLMLSWVTDAQGPVRKDQA